MSSDRVVDDFLTGMPRRTSPPAAFGAGAPGGGMSTANMLNILNLQQRLLTAMNEAVDLVGQLQQLGAFPSDADNSGESAVEATQLLLASMIEQRQMEAGAAPMHNNNNINNNNAAVAAASAMGFGGGMAPPPSMETMMTRGVNVHDDANNEHGDLFAPPSQAQEGVAGAGVLGKSGNGARSANKQGGDAPRMLAFVEFKRNKIRKYVCEVADVRPGTYVLVDGDRGTDCALLVQTISYDGSGGAFVVSMDDCNIDDEKIKLENGRVLRAASNEDIDRLHNVIYNAEAVALKTCRQRCKELGIDIKVLDAEYQFDMKKISFYFDSDHSVDFRALVRELYRTFGARIWMENVNPRVKNAVPDSHAGGGGHGNNGGRRRN